MSVALVLANMLAVAMPPAPMAAHEGGLAAAQESEHAHCAHHDMASHAQAGHGSGSSCCLGKTCVCVHLCGDVLALAALPALIAPSTKSSAMPPSRPYATISARLLRPPIA